MKPRPSDVVRYGIVGSGMMGVEHILNLKAVDGAIVTAVADPFPTSKQWARDAMDGDEIQMFEDHRAMLAADVCDVVIIATPNMTHHDILIEILDAPVHILVEKPLCTTVADCRDVIDRAVGRDHLVGVGLEYRYMPPIARLVREIRNGTVGTLKMLSIREHRFPFLEKVDDWNRFNRNTGGTLVEKCCHFFDLMNLIVDGDPVRVMASGGQDVNHLDETYEGEVPDILDNAMVVVEFSTGARASLDLCMFAEASTNQEEISAVGDEAKVEAFLPSGELRIGRRSDGWGPATVRSETVTDDRVKHEGFHHGSSYLEHVDFLDAVRNGGQPAVSLNDGLRSVAIGVAAQRSIAEGRVVLMTEIL